MSTANASPISSPRNETTVKQVPFPTLPCVEKVKQFVLYFFDCLRACIWGRNEIFKDACSKGHVYTVEYWVDKVDLKSTGAASLYNAALKSHLAIASLLVKKQVDPSAPFIEAFLNDKYETCSRLYDFLTREQISSIDQAMRNKTPSSSLMWQLGDWTYVHSAQRLMEKLVSKGLSLGDAFARLLNREGIRESLETLVGIHERASGENIWTLEVRNKPLLHEAAQVENREALQYLLSREDAPTHIRNIRDNEGRTVLMVACASRNVPIENVKSLLPYSDLEAVDNEGMNALMHACKAQYHSAVSHLLTTAKEREQDITSARDKEGKTALMHACEHYENRSQLESLVNSYSDESLQIRDEKNRIAVHHAIFHGNFYAFINKLNVFDAATRESFVLTVLSLDPLQHSILSNLQSLIRRGCGVENGELSSKVQEAIEQIKSKRKEDPEWPKEVDEDVSSALESLKTRSLSAVERKTGD